jgi:hypothetical protein
MILGAKTTLTDQVLEHILKENSTAIDIQRALETENKAATIQGIYKALRELISENIILKHGKNYFINNKWRGDVEKLITHGSHFILHPGEEVKYKFKKIESTDIFWKNIFSDIGEETGKFPVFHFNPHQFWILIKERRQSEIDYYNNLDKKNIFDYTLIGGKTEFDNNAKKLLTSKYHQLYVDDKTSFNSRDHISIFKDYIIITRLPNSFVIAIDNLYKKCKSEEELTIGLEKVFKKSGNIVIIIKNSPEKAKKLRKVISRDLYISKELKEQFNLF